MADLSLQDKVVYIDDGKHSRKNLNELYTSYLTLYLISDIRASLINKTSDKFKSDGTDILQKYVDSFKPLLDYKEASVITDKIATLLGTTDLHNHWISEIDKVANELYNNGIKIIVKLYSDKSITDELKT